MIPRFEIAGFALTVVVVFLFTSRFKTTFPNSETSPLEYDGRSSMEHHFLGDVVEVNPFEDAKVQDVFGDDSDIDSSGQVVDRLEDTMNSTLGFAKVFVISMPDRSDKRDAFSLQARLSNITFEVRDGVAGADVPAKALPLVSTYLPLKKLKLAQD